MPKLELRIGSSTCKGARSQEQVGIPTTNLQITAYNQIDGCILEYLSERQCLLCT